MGRTKRSRRVGKMCIRDRVESFCDHVAIMKQGELLAYGTVEDLEKQTGTRSLNDVFLTLTDRDGVDDRQTANREA